MTSYKTKSAARRAAKAACKKLLGPFYEAYENVDFYIHESGYFYNRAYHFTLTVAC